MGKTREGERVDVYATNQATRYGELIQGATGSGFTKFVKVTDDGKILTEVHIDDKAVSSNNPFPTDGDSVYAKDIDTSKSNLGNFQSQITDLFDDYSSSVVDSTTNNPKTLSIYLKRPIETSKIGFGSLTGTFSNVKILLKDLAGNVREVVDDSNNNTKYTSNLYYFHPTAFIEAEIQFHTSDPIELTGAYIPKEIHTTTQLRALRPDGTETYIDATNGGNLKISLEEFDGTFYSNPLPTTGGTIITNAIRTIGYDLSINPFTATTNLSNDYELDSLILNFSTNESRTITVTGPDGTILAGGTDDTSTNNVLRNNTDKNIVIKFNLPFDAGENITVDITQTSGTCIVDVILKIIEGGNVLVGNPVLGAGNNVIGSVKTLSTNYAVRMIDDSTDPNITYVGIAAISSPTSSAVWQIKKMDKTSGLVITWADGNDNFDNVWDDRESLNYS